MLHRAQASALCNKAWSHYTCGKGKFWLMSGPFAGFARLINIRDAIAP
jgi:hypothetical protein